MASIGKDEVDSPWREFCCFSESYVQGINGKVPQFPKDIEWHFIEHLQSNKMKELLAAVLNLAGIEGINNENKAFESFVSSR